MSHRRGFGEENGWDDSDEPGEAFETELNWGATSKRVFSRRWAREETRA